MKQKLKDILCKFSKTQWTIIVILLLMTFVFNENNLATRFKYNTEIEDLEKQIDYHQKQKEENLRKLNELKSNKENLEKFARENYLMKKAGEDVYLIENKKEETEKK